MFPNQMDGMIEEHDVNSWLQHRHIPPLPICKPRQKVPNMVLLPMPAMPSPTGAPSDYVKSRRPIVLSILVAQTIVCAMRMLLLLDIMGGFIMAIMVGLGWYAWKEDMHITFICYWGMMCLINGAFDLVKFIDYWVKSPRPLFDASLPSGYNLMSATILLIPLTTLPGAVLAWYMYKNQTDADAGYGPYSGTRREAEPLWSGQGRPLGSARGGPVNVFGGSGQRLGGTA